MRGRIRCEVERKFIGGKKECATAPVQEQLGVAGSKLSVGYFGSLGTMILSGAPARAFKKAIRSAFSSDVRPSGFMRGLK